MAKDALNPTSITVQDSKSGRFVTVKGAGALKGRMTINKNVDLTKPISGPIRGGLMPSRGNTSGPLSSKSGLAGHSATKR